MAIRGENRIIDSLSDVKNCLFELLNRLNNEFERRGFELIYTTIPSSRSEFDGVMYIQICYRDVIQSTTQIGECEIEYVNNNKTKCIFTFNNKEEKVRNLAGIKRCIKKAIYDAYDNYMNV